MPLATGTRIGPYEVLAPLGAGGMGEVYRARDTDLDRSAALKALPDAFAGDPERLARFEREAKVLAALSHPNIASIYGLIEADGRRHLALELVEGETLADRIKRGPLAIEDTLEVARQVASALEAAHDAGIVHRDLKPANVMVRPDGTAKVLDFGLATVASGAAGAPASDSPSAGFTPDSPTMARAYAPGISPTYGSFPGVILGTASYMSPEQARGRPVDRRSDLWSFGCVLYECLVGRPAFEGETISDLMVSILREEPHWEALPAATPTSIRRLLRRCLAKDVRRRLSSAADARLEIEETLSGEAEAYEVAGAAAAGAGGRGAVAAAMPRLHLTLVPPPGVSFQLRGQNPGPPVLSPDGTRVAFTGRPKQGPQQIWVRSLRDGGAVPLAGTDGAQYPFWSPDSQSIGFFAEGKLKRIPAAGGPTLVLAEAIDGKGGAWSPQGEIVYTATPTSPLLAVSENAGSTPRAVTDLAATPRTDSHRLASFLPDGRRFLFVARADVGLLGGPATWKHNLYVGSLDGDAPRLLGPTESQAILCEGQVLRLRQRALYAEPFDPKTLEFGGRPVLLASGVAMLGPAGLGMFSVSQNGILAYQLAPPEYAAHISIYDRSGRFQRRLAENVLALGCSLSPDAKRLAVSIHDARANIADIWIYDMARGTRDRFTFGPDSCDNPVWSPDGKSLAYAAITNEGSAILVKTLGDNRPERKLLEHGRELIPDSWSPDGNTLIVAARASISGTELRAVSIADPTQSTCLLPEDETGYQSRFSPDGRWYAYTGYATGRIGLFVRPFPGPGRKSQVSDVAGHTPRFRKDGKELMFRAMDGRVLFAPVKLGRDKVEVGPAEIVPDLRVQFRSFTDIDVSPDGKFLVVLEEVQENLPGLTIVTDWMADLAPR